MLKELAKVVYKFVSGKGAMVAAVGGGCGWNLRVLH